MSETAPTHVEAAAPPPPRGLHTPTLIVLTVAVTVVLIAGIGLAGAAIGRSSRSGAPGTVTVSATGTVRGTPDTIEFTVGVQTTRATATGALAANDARVAHVEQILTNRKVPKSDLQTTGLNIWQDTNQYGQITGFTVDDSLEVTMHNVTQAGYAIEAAVRAGGNGIEFDGITLSISNDSSLLAKARARALAAARDEARQDAQASGASVGAVLRISDHETQSNSPVTFGYGSAYATNAAALVPLRAGTQPVTVNVTVVYALGG